MSIALTCLEMFRVQKLESEMLQIDEVPVIYRCHQGRRTRWGPGVAAACDSILNLKFILTNSSMEGKTNVAMLMVNECNGVDNWGNKTVKVDRSSTLPTLPTLLACGLYLNNDDTHVV